MNRKMDGKTEEILAKRRAAFLKYKKFQKITKQYGNWFIKFKDVELSNICWALMIKSQYWENFYYTMWIDTF